MTKYVRKGRARKKGSGAHLVGRSAKAEFPRIRLIFIFHLPTVVLADTIIFSCTINTTT